MIGRSWTTKKAKRVWERLRSGVSAETIAADLGCTVTNIHRRLRTAGYDPAEARRIETNEEMQAAKIYARRREGAGFPEIAVELGLDPSQATTRCLYMRLVRYCERADVPYPHMPRKRYHYGPQGKRVWTITQADIDQAIAVLKRAAEKDKVYDTERLSLDLPRSEDKHAKALVAEMRRRRLLADGLAPRKMAKPAVKLTAAETDILEAIHRAWGDPSRGCETLSSLENKLGYAHHTTNLAIIKLRKLGLVEPRGFLYLRDHA